MDTKIITIASVNYTEHYIIAACDLNYIKAVSLLSFRQFKSILVDLAIEKHVDKNASNPNIHELNRVAIELGPLLGEIPKLPKIQKQSYNNKHARRHHMKSKW